MARPVPVLCATILLGAFLAPAFADDLAPEALLEQRAPTVVSLRFVLKSGGTESPTEAHGTVVDPTGLVVLPNDELGGEGVKVSDLKVIFGSDPKEWEAVVVARDKNLSLAYLQVLGLGDKAVPAVDFSAGVEPKIGLTLFGITRDGRGFDYAPSIQRCYVSSRVEKPRVMWGLSGDFGSAGLPVYDAAGRPAGLLADQESSEGAAEEGQGTMSATFLLTLADVNKSLAAAKKRVPEAVAKAEAAKKEAPEPAVTPTPGTGGAGMGEAPPSPSNPAPPAPETPAPKAPTPTPKPPEAPKAPETPK